MHSYTCFCWSSTLFKKKTFIICNIIIFILMFAWFKIVQYVDYLFRFYICHTRNMLTHHFIKKDVILVYHWKKIFLIINMYLLRIVLYVWQPVPYSKKIIWTLRWFSNSFFMIYYFIIRESNKVIKNDKKRGYRKCTRKQFWTWKMCSILEML